MQRLSLLLSILLITVAAHAQTARYALHVEDFKELRVVDGIAVDYSSRTDSAGWVVFYASPEQVSNIMVSSNLGRLTLQSSADQEPIKGLPRVRVYSSRLNKVTNSGDSLVRVNLSQKVADFSAHQIGNGRLVVKGLDAETLHASATAGKGSLTISGKAAMVKMKAVGAETINARELNATNVTCFVMGPSHVACAPADRLKIYGMGSGQIMLYSKPKHLTNNSIGIKVVRYK